MHEWIYTQPDGGFELLLPDGRARRNGLYASGVVIDAWAKKRGDMKTGQAYLVLSLRTGKHRYWPMPTLAWAEQAAQQIVMHLTALREAAHADCG